MKHKVVLITGIVVVAVIVIAVIIFFVLTNILDLFSNTPAPHPTESITSSVTSTTVPNSVSTTALIMTTSPSPVTPLPSTTATVLPSNTVTETKPASTTQTPALNKNVEFEVVSVSGSGFTRTVNGKLTNNGQVDLNNARLRVEMYSNGKLIKNDSQNFTDVDFGTIRSGAGVTGSITIKLSILDGLYVQQNGVSFVLAFSSDELTRNFSYDYAP